MAFVSKENIFSSRLFGLTLLTPLTTTTVLSIALITAVVTLLLSNIFKSSKDASKNFPPGPRTLFGLLIKSRPLLQTRNLKYLPSAKLFEAEYDKIMGISCSLGNIVIINDIELVKEAFSKPALAGRVPMKFVRMFPHEQARAIALNNGKSWREVRQFVTSYLKISGMGQKSRCPAIALEARDFVSDIRTRLKHPFSTIDYFINPSFNGVWQMVSSQRFDIGDPLPRKLNHLLEAIFDNWILAVCLNQWLTLSRWFISLTRIHDPCHKFNQEFLGFTTEFVQDRKLQFEQGQRRNDLTDQFISKIKATTDPTSSFYGNVGYENLCEIVRDLFVGGTATVSTTMSWALLYLALHPDKQEKLQKEIDTVLQGQAPILYDRAKMPYTEAVINETLRRSSNACVGLPHEALEDTTIGKYHIPKDSNVNANIYAIHHCEKTWGDPYNFRPERFLNSEETALVKHESFIPFSVGRRMCPGMSLAYDELFMFVTFIFRELSVHVNPDEPRPEMWCQLEYTLKPPPHTIIFTERKSPFKLEDK